MSLLDAAAAGAVGSEAGVPGDARDRADVDDAAGAARNHVPGDGLSDEERAAEVGVENGVPIVPGDVGGALADVAAGIVDEDIDLAKLMERVGDGGFDARLVADIEFDGCDSPAQCADFVGERSE